METTSFGCYMTRGFQIHNLIANLSIAKYVACYHCICVNAIIHICVVKNIPSHEGVLISISRTLVLTTLILVIFALEAILCDVVFNVAIEAHLVIEATCMKAVDFEGGSSQHPHMRWSRLHH